MVQIFKAQDAEVAGRAGYEARYIADLVFKKPLDSCGVILVDLHESGRSAPHAHEHLEEAFIVLTDINMYVDDVHYSLKAGDVVLVGPGEAHSPPG